MRGYEDNIKINFQNIKVEDVDWIHLAPGYVLLQVCVNKLMNQCVS
jgi:hypothetical protein